MDAEQETASKLWSKACSVIRKKITGRAFSQGFEGIVPLRMDDHKIILGVSDEIYEQWLKNNYSDIISDGLNAAFGQKLEFDLETGHDAAALSGDTLTLPPYAIVILKEK